MATQEVAAFALAGAVLARINSSKLGRLGNDQVVYGSCLNQFFLFRQNGEVQVTVTEMAESEIIEGFRPDRSMCEL